MIATSTRPIAASTCCVNVACTPPVRRKLPSWTARTRRAAGLKVIVSVTLESCDAPAIEIGTVYGPAPTRNSGPGGERRICPPVGIAAVATGGVPPAAPCGVPAAGGTSPGCGAGATGCAGAAGSVVVPGTCELPGGTTTIPPGPGAAGAPGGATPLAGDSTG